MAAKGKNYVFEVGLRPRKGVDQGTITVEAAYCYVTTRGDLVFSNSQNSYQPAAIASVCCGGWLSVLRKEKENGKVKE